MLRLVEPSPRYKAAILDAVAEMQAIGEWDISPNAFAERFDDILREIAAAKDRSVGLSMRVLGRAV